jgi:hypothetical protein
LLSEVLSPGSQRPVSICQHLLRLHEPIMDSERRHDLYVLEGVETDGGDEFADH